MYNSEALQEKWQPVLNHPDLPEITDSYKRAVTAVILENQEREMKEQRGMLDEVTMNTSSDVANWDPVLISLVRRAMPNLMAYDICGVQPMSGPTGLIFAMKARLTGGATSNAEILHDEADTGASNSTLGSQAGTEPGALNGGTASVTTDADEPDIWGVDTAGTYNVQPGDTTAAAEDYDDSGAPVFQDMGFTIEKSTVTARTRALRAAYTMELAQDLKAIHGLDAEAELANILSTEILAEINREIIRTVNGVATSGAQVGTATPGTFDLDTDSNGRWSVEKFKGLHFAIERDANAIATATRRGRGNIIIASADVVAALSMTGSLDTGAGTGAGGQLSADGITGNTFVGTLNGRYKVYVDPYFVNAAGTSHEYVTIGYKGSSPYDAGIFYCPYVPLQMVKAVGEDTFQPKIGFKTRYGLVANPFATALGAITEGANTYYRTIQVNNIM